MKKHIGNLEVSENTQIDFEEITGNLNIRIGVKFEAKTLKTVGGYLYIYAGASLEAPKLETVGGGLYINEGASLKASKLKNKNDENAQTKCRAHLAESFKKKGLIKADGILSWLISRKRVSGMTIFKVKIVGKKETSFIVERDGNFAHGETLQAATDSLRYKVSDRDTSRFKKWKLSTTVTMEDAIQAYRAITGACEQGVRMFCESKTLPKKLKVEKIIELTKGQYGSDKFVQFFQK